MVGHWRLDVGSRRLVVDVGLGGGDSRHGAQISNLCGIIRG